MQKTIISTLLVILCQVYSISGQVVLTLEKSRQLAIVQSENLKIAHLHLDKARQERAAARTLRLPGFSANGMSIHQDRGFEMDLILPTQVPDPATGGLVPNFMVHPVTGEIITGPDGNPLFNMYAWMPLEVNMSGAFTIGLNMEQPIYTGGKIDAGNRMADIGVDMASENLNLQRMKTIEAADNAYWNYVGVSEQVKLAQKAVSMLSGLVEFAQNSLEVGLVSRNDMLKAQVEYNNAKLNLQKAKNGLELSRMHLCMITGLPFDTNIIVADSIIETGQPLPDALQSIDLQQRPETRLLKQNIRMGEENIRMARAEFLPTAGIQVGYSHVGGIEFSGTDFTHTGLNVIGSVKIPLFHWGQRVRKVKNARIDLEIRELEMEKNQQLMQLEVEQARLNLLLAWERIQMNEKALDQASENLRVSRDNYELGFETMTGLLTAQTQWQQAYSELIGSRADYRIRETNWLKVTGNLRE